MNKQTNVIPLRGFDKITFGLNQKAVIDILGSPSEKRNEEYEDGSEQIILDYEELGIDLAFSEEDEFSLGTITVYSENYLLENEEIIGLSEKEFKGKVQAMGYDDLILEDSFDDIGSKDFYSASKAISFWIQDGTVDSITLFPKDE